MRMPLDLQVSRHTPLIESWANTHAGQTPVTIWHKLKTFSSGLHTYCIIFALGTKSYPPLLAATKSYSPLKVLDE